MPSKLVIDFDSLDKVIKSVAGPRFSDETEDYSIYAGNTNQLLLKVREIIYKYIREVMLEPMEIADFTATFNGLVAASLLIGYHYALHALKKLQENCGEIIAVNPDYALNSGKSDDLMWLEKSAITAENIAAFLVAYQRDCFNFNEGEPFLMQSKESERRGISKQVRDIMQSDFMHGAGDIFNQAPPVRHRRPSFQM